VYVFRYNYASQLHKVLHAMSHISASYLCLCVNVCTSFSLSLSVSPLSPPCPINQIDQQPKSSSSLIQGTLLSIKDNFMVDGSRTTAGSRMLERLVAAYDATVVSRLQSQGGVLLGKVRRRRESVCVSVCVCVCVCLCV
jgi:hypothetical protein